MTGRVVALVRRALAAALVVLAAVFGGLPTAGAAVPNVGPAILGTMPSVEAASTPDAVTITLRSVTPQVIGPTSTLTVTGTVQAIGGAVANPAIRLVRPRGLVLTTRSDVQAWATGSTSAATLLLARAPLATTLTPGGSTPFTLTTSTDGLRLTRSYGALPLAVEVVAPEGTVLQSVHTFVGWSAPGAGPTPRVSMSWVAPITLAADPALFATDADARTTAWTAELGPAGRLTRLVEGTKGAKVAWALDPVVIGPRYGTLAMSRMTAGEDPVAGLQARFRAILGAATPPRTLLELPYADPDLAAGTNDRVVPSVIFDSMDAGLLLDRMLGTTVAARVAWPADGRLTDQREQAWVSAYRGTLGAILASADATGGDSTSTPSAPAKGTRGTAVLRWDDTLSDAAAAAGSDPTTVLSLQRFVAETAALVAERPSAARDVLVMLPRGIDADPTLLTQFLGTAQGLPWVSTGDVSSLMATATGDAAPTIEPGPGTAVQEDPVLNAGMIDTLSAQDSVLTTIDSTVRRPSEFVQHWQDVVSQLTSTRWRGGAGAHNVLFGQLLAATDGFMQGLSITTQTTNFLADEGVLRVTVVNDLDQTVDGISLVLTPDNSRIRIVEPAAPVRIEPHSKATVQVRVAAVAAGLVSVDAWLTNAYGTRLGQPTQLTVRANPPGTWMYVVGIAVVALVLVVGLVRGLRRPVRRAPGVDDVDVIAPTPERRLTEAVERPPATRPPARL